MRIRTRKNNAFTLIELLVVIAIIALLLSILMPSLTKAKELAKRAVCTSNMHQWAIAMQSYTMDNNDKYPERYWNNNGTITFYHNAPYYYYMNLRFDLLSCFIKIGRASCRERV